MYIVPLLLGWLGLLSSVLIFGLLTVVGHAFIPGLSALTPGEAIEVMRAMFEKAQNGPLARAFIATPVILALTAVVAWHANIRKTVCILFAAGAMFYALGVLALTLQHQLPLAEELQIHSLSSLSLDHIWSDFIVQWQYWNQLRTGFAATTVLCVAFGLWLLSSSETRLSPAKRSLR